MKKNTLFKTIAILFLGLSVLTWIIPASQADGAEIMSLGLYRVSLYNLVEYPYLSIQYFLQTLIFILAVGGMYGVLYSTDKYRNVLDRIAKSMKGKENIFLIVVAFVLAALSSVFGLNLLLFAFIPFICGIILIMGYDKITAMLVTFMSTLIGVIGGTYGQYITGYINDIIGTTYQTEVVAKVGLFVLSFIVFISFTLKHAKETKKQNEVIESDEKLFIAEKKNSKKPSWPIFAVMGALLVLMILGYTNWSGAFNIKFFTDLHETITEWAIGEHTVIAYLINGISEFGQWNLAEYTIMVIIATLLFKVFYNVKTDRFLESFGSGVKTALKPAFIVVFAYIVVFIAAYHPYLVTVVDFLCNTVGNGLADLIGVSFISDIIYVIFAGISTVLTSVMNIEMLYVVQSTLPYMSSLYAEASNSLAIIVQAFYGLTSFVAPTSTMMILGLEYLGIPYKEWLKKSYKLVLELLAIVFIVILVVLFI